MQQKNEELWITNICRTKDISIGDLNLKIRAGQSINLLAKNKRGKPLYAITREMIEKSVTSGSVFNNEFLKVRKVAPVFFSNIIPIISDVSGKLYTRNKRSPTEIEAPDYPDLEVPEIDDEEMFAAENAEMDFADRKPLLAVDPKFIKT